MASATCTLQIDAGHRKTSRPEEYVGYLVNQPDGDEPVLSYTLDTSAPLGNPGQAAPSLVNTFSGATETPPATIALAPATSANPTAEDTITATHGQTTHTIYHSKRGCMVTRWATNLTGLGISQEWLIRVGAEGLGGSLNHNIRWIEALGEARQNMHNPTTGGALLLPYPANDDLNDLLTSAPLYHANASGGSGTAYAASGCIPLQWDSDGTIEPPHTNHGGTSSRAILWWRHKFFKHVDPFYGGRESISRVTGWSFVPRQWDESEFGGDVGQGGGTAKLAFGHQLPVFTWAIFDEANWFDCATQTLTPVTSWDAVPDPGLGGWEAYDDRTRYLSGVDAPDGESVIPSGYGAIILTRTLDKFTVAVAAKVANGPATIGKIGRNTTQTHLVMVRHFPGDVPVTPDIGGWDTVLIGAETSSFVGREAGWHGQTLYVYTGSQDDVQAALHELYTSGLLDARPDESLIPQVVADGTEFDISTTQEGSALCTLEFSGTATADATSGGPGPVEVSEFVVETGAGIADAESYVTLSEADSYALRWGNPSAWVNATAAQKQLWLRMAARNDIDLVYGPFFSGYRATETQGLEWPRVKAGDNATNAAIDDDVVPKRVKDAQCYMALEYAAGNVGSLQVEEAGESGVVSSTDSFVGGSEARTYSGHRSTQRRFRVVEGLLAPLLQDNDRVDRA